MTTSIDGQRSNPTRFQLSEAETPEEKSRRIRNGRIAVILAFAWWIVSVGGVITVINMQS